MYSELKFRRHKEYIFVIGRLERIENVNHFVLRFQGKETNPGWAACGWKLSVPVSKNQEMYPLESFIGKQIKCKVKAHKKFGFPILEQAIDRYSGEQSKIKSLYGCFEPSRRADLLTLKPKVITLITVQGHIVEHVPIPISTIKAEEKVETQEEECLIENAPQYVSVTISEEEQKFNRLLQEAEAGNAESQYEVSLLYRDGIGVNKDFEKAVEWCIASAKGGFIRAAYALYKLGEIHEEGKAAPFDMQRALYYYQISAEQNLLVAQLKLAELYEQGWSGDTDTTQPLHWYQCAALNGHVESCFKLGVYHFAAISAENNEPLAFKWFKTAADAGHKEAAFHVALSYLSGRGVEQSGDKAVAYLEKSIDADIDEALYLLGLCYLDGYFTPKNEQKAFDLFKRAAMRGHVASAYRVASCYEYARGVSQDYQQAYEWYTKAAEEGEYQAITTLSSPQWVIRKMSI